MIRSAGILVATLILAIACGGGGGGNHGGGGPLGGLGPRNTPLPAQSSLLVKGVVASLPNGTLLISVSDVSVAAGGSASANGPGVVYVVSGMANVPGTGAVPAGSAAFLGAATGGTLTNSGSAAAEWYFLAVEPASARTQPPPVAGGKRLFTTDDLPPLPHINQAEALTKVTLPVGAQSDQYRPNGVEAVIAVGGTVQVSSDSFHGSKTLAAGSGGYDLEGSQMQEINPGSKPASYLSFILLPDGKQLTRSAH